MVTTRPATPTDAPAVAALLTAEHPDDPQGPEELAARWAEPSTSFIAVRSVIERDGEPAGLLFWGHAARWPEAGDRYGHISIRLAPAAQTAAVVDPVLEAAETALRAAGANRFEQRLREDDAYLLEAMERHGYRRDRLSKAWELDLVAGAERLLALREATRAQMAAAGVRLLTMAASPAPDRLRRFHALDVATTEDIPHTVPFTMPTYEEFEQHWRLSPDVREDRVWLAWAGDELVALSFLRYPVSTGVVWTGYTACRRDHRGRGIARAVKLETLGQAVELGVPRVRTDNDEANAPMLHINEALGYHRVPGYLSYLK